MRKNFITIGTFDGVHLGHRHLIYVLGDLAAQNKMASCVLAFKLPPRGVIANAAHPHLLTTPEEKKQILASLGPARVAMLDFAKLRALTATQFFDTLLKKYKMGGLLVGPDFAFGKDRKGDINFLRRACAKHKIILVEADFAQEGGQKISSSRVRAALRGGDIAQTNALLGRPYAASGKIIYGRQLGRTIGFPTANMDVDARKILPKGVYAVRAHLGAQSFKAICNIGTRPTVEARGKQSAEVHLLNFDRDIYGQTLHIDFIARIRPEQKFPNLPALKKAISKDAKQARKLLK